MADEPSLRKQAADALLEAIRESASKPTTPQSVEHLAQAYALTVGAMPKGDGSGRSVRVR